MKLLKTISTLAVAAVLLFSSCTKENLVPNANKPASNNNNAPVKVVKYNGGEQILAFKDSTVYRQTIEHLQDLMKREAQKDDGNIYKPLKEFVNQYGFDSKIFEFIKYEQEWLSQKDLDFSKLPNSQFNNIDAVGLAVRNDNYAVMIQGEIVVNGDNGSGVIIEDGSLETLSKIENISITNLNEDFAPNISVKPEIKINDVNLDKGRRDLYYDGGYSCLVAQNGYYINSQYMTYWGQNNNWHYNGGWHAYSKYLKLHMRSNNGALLRAKNGTTSSQYINYYYYFSSPSGLQPHKTYHNVYGKVDGTIYY